jgi:hypothetical protein
LASEASMMLHQPANSIRSTLSHIFNHLQNNQAMKISSAHQSSSFNIFGVWGFDDAPSASQLNQTHPLSHLQSLAEQSSYENFISPLDLIVQHFWRLIVIHNLIMCWKFFDKIMNFITKKNNFITFGLWVNLHTIKCTKK